MSRVRVMEQVHRVRRVLTLPKRSLVFLVMAVLFLSTAMLNGSKSVRIQRDDLVGTWVGLTTDELQMIRVTLEPQGKGIIGVSFLDEQPCVFRLASWLFDGGKLAFNFDRSSATCVQKIQGLTRGSALELTLSGADWKRTASLRREEKLADRWERLRFTMSQKN